MPELPEVEVVRRGLADHATGRVVHAVEVADARVSRRAREVAAPLTSLVGRTWGGASRRGKYLWVPVGDGLALTGHLGMSGQVLVNDEDVPSPRHTRLRLHLSGGVRLDVVDQRLFGAWWVTHLVPTADGCAGGAGTTDALVPAPLSALARDALDPYLDRPGVVRALRRTHRPIKAALLDQHLISGIGNIYADEALHAARLHPARIGPKIPARRLHDLLDHAAATMEAALAVGGTSFDALYVDTSGNPGYFQRSLAAYGRAGQPCLTCGRPLRRLQVAGRSSHVCLTCQRAPRRPLR